MGKAKQIISKVFLCLLLLLLLVAPVGLVLALSKQEMAQYQQPEKVILQESSYGIPAKAMRMDVQAYVLIDGTYTSDSYAFQELKVKDPGKIRWVVSTGQYIQKGQLLGLYGQEQVVSAYDGILKEISSYSADAYLRFTTMENLKLECAVSPSTLQELTNGTLTTEQGEAVSVVGASPIVDSSGRVTVWLDCPSTTEQYGARLQQVKIMTGQVYKNVLVLDADCVYQKGTDSPWFVREVSSTGIYIREVEVKIGYANDEIVCVTSIAEGAFFDSGYKAVIGGV